MKSIGRNPAANAREWSNAIPTARVQSRLLRSEDQPKLIGGLAIATYLKSLPAAHLE
jgi:hypothetical protein